MYQIRCTLCQEIYIGETCRTMRSRFLGHLSDENSAVYKHLKRNDIDPTCTVAAFMENSCVKFETP